MLNFSLKKLSKTPNSNENVYIEFFNNFKFYCFQAYSFFRVCSTHFFLIPLKTYNNIKKHNTNVTFSLNIPSLWLIWPMC